ncbi:hypothetical protein, partial [Chitinophaga sp. sic0106]|uniref:hypothetical protein n=1 Tax=Chitinophaga sp. sic0106 TaxID=2854785 RepID=UPI001C466623
RNKSKHPLNKGIANQLLQSLRGIGVGVNGHNNPATTGDMPALQQLSGATGATLLEQERQSFDAVAPRAHLNFAVFNDRFKLVEENTGIRSLRNNPDELQSL